MAGSGPRSSEPRAAPVALAALIAAAGGCVERLDPIGGTTSLEVALVSPADPGGEAERLPDSARDVTISLRALDADGELDTGFEATVEVHAHFLGSLTPDLGAFESLAAIPVSGGTSAAVDLSLPPVFGETYLWIEDGGEGATYATGTSPSLWFRDPFLADVSRPEDEGALDALEASPLERKQINVTASRYGETGRMVVTGIYAQGYTLADVDCQGAAGAPPCTTGAYDSIFVFSFSRPEDEQGRRLAVGDRIERLTGSIGEFNGLTEVNFPQSFRALDADGDPEPGDPASVPAPVVFDPAWLVDAIEMEKVEAALIAVDGATVCPLDGDFDGFSQWKLDVGNGCPAPEDQDGTFLNVITKGQVNDFVPADHVGEVLPRVVGTLRPVQTSGGGFNVWILYPRSIGDIELP